MTRFRIDDPAIDLEALEARVMESIERRRGSRFTEEELEELRATRLRPRPRREDLPRGLVEEMSSARARLPEVPRPPGSEPVSLEHEEEEELPATVDPEGGLYESHAPGIKGRLLRLLRRLMRPFYRSTLNLEHVLVRLRDELMERDERVRARQERSHDALKDALDRRVDGTIDWAGEHMSKMTGGLERRRERDLHLLHNLVFEHTSARLEVETLRDRLDEANRRTAQLEERQRTLERILLDRDGS